MHKTIWSPIGVLIIDEIGMMGARSLARIDERLRALKPESRNERFGGVHVIGFGDLRQLKPVGESEVFSDLNSLEEIGTHDRTMDNTRRKPLPREETATQYNRGYELWRNGMNAGIELDENKRSSGDRVYADALDLRWAVNAPTKNDILAVNSRLVRDNPDVSQISSVVGRDSNSDTDSDSDLETVPGIPLPASSTFLAIVVWRTTCSLSY